MDWSAIVYELGMGGLAQEILANSVLVSREEHHIRLLLQPEILELASDQIRNEIKAALEQKLGVSLQLILTAAVELERATPQQDKTAREERERQDAIAAIREDKVVRKLGQALAVELDETSVVKVED